MRHIRVDSTRQPEHLLNVQRAGVHYQRALKFIVESLLKACLSIWCSQDSICPQQDYEPKPLLTPPSCRFMNYTRYFRNWFNKRTVKTSCTHCAIAIQSILKLNSGEKYIVSTQFACAQLKRRGYK